MARKKKHHGKMHHHTGPVHHTDMHDHLPGVHDSETHHSHHAGHKKHDNAGAPIVGHQNYGHHGVSGGEAIGHNEC